MRVLYEERQETLVSEFNKHLTDFGSLKSCHAGLHLVTHLNPKFKDEDITKIAASNNINVASLSQFCGKRKDLNGLLLGYSAYDTNEIKLAILQLKRVFTEYAQTKRL